MSQQLVKKGANGRYDKVMPKSWIEAIKDKNTGQTLVEILQGFNMYFLPYNGNTSATRCLVPIMLRKKGLWITYVKYDGNVYTEWYAADELDDKSWGDSSNWRIGNNTLVGDITISANGNWVINGTETEFKAVGEKGNTPLLRVANNRLQVSYDLGDTYIDVTNNPVYTKFRWLATTGDTQANNVGRIQASTDEGKTWTNMSNDFTNNLHISRYIGVNESLPTSGIAEGTIYAKGPYYAEDDTLNDNPIYRLWVYAWKGNTLAWQDNGEFQSIAAGVVQETGDSEVAVMSQKAVTEKLSELGSEVGEIRGAVFGPITSKIINKRYSVSQSTWINGKSIFYNVTDRKSVSIGVSNGSYYAFFDDFDFDALNGVFNSSTEKPLLASNGVSNLPIPTGAKYLWIQLSNGTQDNTPEYVRIDGINCSFDGADSPKDNVPTKITGLEKKINDEVERVDNIEHMLSNPITSKVIDKRYSISQSAWIGGKSIFYDITNREFVSIGKSNGSYYAFIDEFDFSSVSGTFNSETPKPVLVSDGVSDLQIPSDAKYLWVQLYNNAEDNTPEYVKIDNIECSFDGSSSPKENIITKIIGLDNKIEENAEIIDKIANGDFIGIDSVIAIAHRGMSAINCPENSIHSITNAAMQQVKIVECDVWFTSDNVPVVIHDSTINRTMNTVNDEDISGIDGIKVSSLTWEELSSLYIYKTSVEKYKTRICTFYEWMDRVVELGLIPFFHGVDISLIPYIQKRVGDNFIYMGYLALCKSVREISKKCFVMYQNAAQQDSDTGQLSDEDAVVADMLSIGGLCGYSSMNYETFTDTFIEKLKSANLYWQYSTNAPSKSTLAISRGVNFLLINNWCNNKLTYRPIYRLRNDLSNIDYSATERGMPKYNTNDVISFDNLPLSGNNIRMRIVVQGFILVNIGGIVSAFGSTEMRTYQFGINIAWDAIDISITIQSDNALIQDICIEES